MPTEHRMARAGSAGFCVLVLLMAMVAACTNKPADSAPVLSSALSADQVVASVPAGTIPQLLIRAGKLEESYMAAQISGTLVVDLSTSCVAIQTEGVTVQLEWPSGYSVAMDGDIARVSDQNGVAIGTVGQSFTAGGGGIHVETWPGPLLPCITTQHAFSVAPRY